MPSPIKLKLVIKTLNSNGFVFISQKGSHAKFRKTGSPTRSVIVKTTKKEIPHGTFRSILLHSGLKENNFRKNR
ncbi:type II toxin-antitoxin system HicA family toxin [Candidatus Parcubacteria bacterium]|nr:type II toxin-antitoxin system HicA family toxin [Candidatus Parcubacteria bacterium]